MQATQNFAGENAHEAHQEHFAEAAAAEQPEQLVPVVQQLAILEKLRLLFVLQAPQGAHQLVLLGHQALQRRGKLVLLLAQREQPAVQRRHLLVGVLDADWRAGRGGSGGGRRGRERRRLGEAVVLAAHPAGRGPVCHGCRRCQPMRMQ